MNQLQICNLALDSFGGTPIAALDDANPRAEVCARNFDHALEAVLRSFAWNFAKFRATLTADVTPPDFEWAVRYALPSDFVSMVQLNGVAVAGDPGDFYELENGFMFTDETTGEIQYIRKPTPLAVDPDPQTGILMDDFLAIADPLFVEALVIILASKISPALRNDGGQLSVQQEQRYIQKRADARMRDGNERKSRRYDPASESRFVASRWWPGRS